MDIHNLPFQCLSDYDIESLFKNTKQEILARLNNPVLLRYLKNQNCVNLQPLDSIDCNYYTEDELNLKIKYFSKCNLSTFHLNIRKLGLHRNELIAFLSMLDIDYDIIILTEVGKYSKSYITNLFVDYEPFYDLPLENDYGGVAVFIKSDYNPIECDFKMHKSCTCTRCNYENVFVEFVKNGVKSLAGGIYRHPGGDISHFNNDLEMCLSKCSRYDLALVAGDTNIDLIQQHADSIDYVTSFAAHNFLPYITRPTRITSHSATLIDHIFVKCKEIDRKIFSGNLFCSITDHLPNFCIIDINKTKNMKLPRPKTRLFSEENMLKYATMVYDTNWIDEFETYDNVNDICDFFMHNLKRYFNQCFPLVTVSRSKHKDKPWLTPALKQSIRRKYRLSLVKLKNPTPENKKRYSDYRDIVDRLISDAQLLYYQDIFNHKKNSVKLLWDEFGPILGRKGAKTKNKIVKIVINKKTLKEPLEIANAMNDHFCEIGPKLASNISEDGKHFGDFLSDPSEHTFFLKAVDESDVLEELLKLNHRKSAGPDEFSPKLIKLCSYSMFKPLTYIFNKSIRDAVYPDCFKIAKIVPLWKAEKRCDPSNYRPISLLNCFDKIFEKLINKQLKSFLKQNDLLYEYQYSFREGFSTDLALLEFNDYVKKEIDKGNFVLTLFIDLKKAFDTVNHAILIKKLDYYGIRGHCNTFFSSYLENRKQYVRCNNVDSSVKNMVCGVPQGSVLGPTLFLLYVNDMINCIRYSKLQLFADDTMSSLSGKRIHLLFGLLKREIKNLRQWFNANRLSLNADKTFYSVFHSRNSMIPDFFNSMTICGMTIKRKKTAKYLGLTFDEVLSWRHHIESLLSGLAKYFNFFYHLRRVLPVKFKLQLFHSYVYSKIAYGLHCYGATHKTSVKSVQVVCNKLLRILMLKDRRYPTNTLYKEFNMLKIDDFRNFLAVRFVHRSVYPNEFTPDQLKTYFQLNINVHNRVLRDNLKIRVPLLRSALGQTCINWYGGNFWNSLDIDIRSECNLCIFKKEVKKHIINNY